MRAGIVVTVTPEDRSRLEAIVSDRNRAQKHVARARVLLATGEGLGTMEIIARSGLSKPAVWRWQARYMADGVEGLLRDKTRKPGKAPLPSETVARVVELTLSEAPGETTHWTSRAMAKLVGVGVISVQRIWKANGLTPHRMRTFKLSKDPLFVEKFSDVVGLYVEPPAHEGVPVDRAVQDHGGDQARSTQGPDESGGLPMAEGHRSAEPLAPRRPAMGAGHVRRSPGLVDENQPVRVEVELAFKPGEPTAQDVGTVLFFGPGHGVWRILDGSFDQPHVTRRDQCRKISTRRFCSRPSGVPLSRTGSSSQKPSTSAAFRPSVLSAAATLCARERESAQLPA